MAAAVWEKPHCGRSLPEDLGFCGGWLSKAALGVLHVGEGWKLLAASTTADRHLPLAT